MQFFQFCQFWNFPVYVSQILNGILKCKNSEIKIKNEKSNKKKQYSFKRKQEKKTLK